MCCGDRFDRDELGIDPEEDETGVFCEECGQPVEECECEDDDAELSL
jgi:hypothetical protein